MRKTVGGRLDTQGQGFVLIVALMVLVVLMTAALWVASSLQQQNWLYRQELQNVELTTRVDAGLALALSTLYKNPDFEGKLDPFGDSQIEVEIKKIDGLNMEVTVKARYSSGARAARARVRIYRDLERGPEVLLWEPMVYRPDEDDTGMQVF